MASAQQIIPVTTQVMLPAPRFLYDFSGKTQLMIYPQTVEDASLRISIKGDNGIVISTLPTYNPFNIVLTGSPMIVTGFAIEDYFLQQNLLFSGITSQRMNQNGLPPGNYRLCVRVVNSDGTFISADDPGGCSNTFSILEAEPPYLINPSCGSNINTALANGIAFSWAPSAGAPPFTTYTLRITEFPQEGMNPAAVMNAATTPMFFEKEIQGYTYFYGPLDPPLQTGKSYAWEVVARDAETKTYFKNNGRSEACWFKYSPPIGNVIAEPVVIQAVSGGGLLQTSFYPLSTVSGRLMYKYNAGTGQAVSVSAQQGGGNSGGGVFISNPTAIPFAGSPSSAFQYNQGLSSSDAKPLANIKISLVKEYIIRKGNFLFNPVENLVLNDKTYLQASAFKSAFPNSGQVMKTTTTDVNGNFSFTFLNADSIGQVRENVSHGEPKENNDFFNGTIYSAYRIVVESPYYCSPENDIIVQPWEAKNAGDVVSLVKDYNLKIVVKSVKTNIEQIYGGENPLSDVDVNVVRKNHQPEVPADEGQGLNAPNPKGQGVIISKNKTGQDGSAFFTRMVRHQKNFNPDRYTIQCSTNKKDGAYNYQDESVRYNAIYPSQMANFPTTGDLSRTTWNSQYNLETKQFDVAMWPAKPRIIGKVINSQGKVMAGVKVVLLSIDSDPANYNLSNLFKMVSTGPDGTFEFNDLYVEFKVVGTGSSMKIITIGPKRTLMIKVNGYKYYEDSSLKVLQLGQQLDLKTIMLEPDGFVSGKVIDADDGSAVPATIIFNNQISEHTQSIFTINPFKHYETFSAPVPSGNYKLKLIADNPEYEMKEYPIEVKKSNNGSAQDLGSLKVYRSMHRIAFTVREKSNNKPVKGVTIKIKQSNVPPFITGVDGKVLLQFSSMNENFSLEIIPPDEKDLLPVFTIVANTNSSTPKVIPDIFLEPCARISGTVTFGNDHKPLPEADVFLDQGSGGTTSLVKTDSNGKYSLGKIPLSPAEAVITAGKSEPGITIIAKTKTVDITKTKIVDFYLPVFDKMSISEIYGLPVIVDSLLDEGATATISGKFISLPDNDNFQIDESNFMMGFSGIKMLKLATTTPQGVPLTKPEQKDVLTGVQSMSLKVHNEFFSTHTSATDYFSVKPDANESGYIEGNVVISNSSFQFNESVISFTKEPIYLSESSPPTNVVKTILAKAPVKKPYQLTDEKGGSIDFSLMSFEATAKAGNCTLNGNTITLNTTISTSLIPLMNPQKFELNIGDLIVKKDGFDPLYNQPGFEFKLEQWTVKCDKWNLSKQFNNILINGGVIKTGIADAPFNSLKIQPNDLTFNGFQFGSMTLSGVVPLEVISTNAFMLYDNKTGSDDKPHWRIAVLASGSQPAAQLKGLPGMEPGAYLEFTVFEALSNNENQVSFGNKTPSVTFYKVYKMKPVSLHNYNNYFQLSGLVDLGIPRVNNNYTGALEFSKKNGAIAMDVKTLPLNFEAPGKVNFINTPLAGTQKLDASGFEAKGRIVDIEGIDLQAILYRKPNDIYVEVKPLGQVLPIGDGVISLTDVKGKMEVKNNDWEFFHFDGIMTGAVGVEGQQRLAFTIHGAIDANSQQVSLKNVNTPFGGMTITYDFKNGRMTGNLQIDKNMGGIGVNGAANLLVDAQGYYIILGGSALVPGIGTIQAGAMFGNYPSISGDAKNTLMQFAYNKNVPATFANGIGGFFITGTKMFPIEIPKTKIDLKVVSVAFGAEVGADARVWMNFAGPGTSFGIGTMVFAHAYFVCKSMICTSFGADARAELGMQGDYNTASGTFSLEGCGSFTVSGYGEQCVGAFDACIQPCVDLGFEKSIKVILLLNSSGGASIDLGLGNCSGQPKLTGGW